MKMDDDDTDYQRCQSSVYWYRNGAMSVSSSLSVNNNLAGVQQPQQPQTRDLDEYDMPAERYNLDEAHSIAPSDIDVSAHYQQYHSMTITGKPVDNTRTTTKRPISNNKTATRNGREQQLVLTSSEEDARPAPAVAVTASSRNQANPIFERESSSSAGSHHRPRQTPRKRIHHPPRNPHESAEERLADLTRLPPVQVGRNCGPY
jgi:hypothetical protein